MNILVINAGSSSLKYQLIDMDAEKVLAKGLVERIGIEGANLQHRPAGKEEVRIETPMKDHVDGMKLVLDALVDKNHGVIASMDEIGAVGHRVVHGGESFKESVLIDDAVMAAIEENVPLAPLHNPANIMGIKACLSVMPKTPMVAVFDTAFHQTMPAKAYLYGLPIDLYRRLKVRRYGFHGTSHMYVSKKAAELLGKPVESLKIVTCHLGNGSSVSAVDGGRSVDTSMGLTPLEGLMMGTRCGDMDPAIVKYLMDRDHLSIEDVDKILNKKSGLLGVSDLSSDMRDITSAAASGNEDAANALEMFCYRIKKYIGAYAAAMGGLDVIVLTAGIGENVAIVREKVLSGLEFLGVKMDKVKNESRPKDVLISTDDSKVKVLVIATDEEMTIARDTQRLVKG
ncbi:acetate/propionate family kinase [Gehongia tenuis]|uniref:Acetate kinase n=1 Tax=Gehongia tenuis TaxID=2763655 RepID=A0A926D5X5_9FIRM|nr:acetate kinase [Gehongia tenuis]MBC8530970.1 acetate kinase [Gehongia tenuis]